MTSCRLFTITEGKIQGTRHTPLHTYGLYISHNNFLTVTLNPPLITILQYTISHFVYTLLPVSCTEAELQPVSYSGAAFTILQTSEQKLLSIVCWFRDCTELHSGTCYLYTRYCIVKLTISLHYRSSAKLLGLYSLISLLTVSEM